MTQDADEPPCFCLIERGEVRAGHRPETVAPWWSFGKTVIAAAALCLVEDGALTLDEPLPGEAFSLRHLLQHTAGQPDYGSLPAYHAAVDGGAPPWPPEALIERVEAVWKPWEPGTIWAYSNIGYLRVRRRIEEITGEDLGAALTRLVFAPLGVADARLARTPGDLEGVAMGPARGYDPAWVYHGLVVGPIESAALWLEGLMTGRLLRPETLAEMRRGHPLPQFARGPFAKPAYGLGLMAPETADGWAMCGHTGGGPGSQIAVYHASNDGRARTAAWFGFSQTEEAETRAYDLLRTDSP
jgi:CubicO group peptidase (beta-lactamase class C family)